MFKITIKEKGLADAARWFTRYEEALDKPDVMVAGIRYVGIGMELGFSSEREGDGGSHWAKLSPTTQRIRRERGYNPEHPILQQSGNLKRMSADTLRTWSFGKRSAVAYDGVGTGMGAGISRRHFKATIRGPKVANHYGGSVTLKDGVAGTLPRRRFFGISPWAAERAADAMMDKFMKEWGRMSRSAKRSG